MADTVERKMTDIDLISDEFDALWGSLGLGFYLDEYEKSLYLTQAQEALVLHLYSSDDSSFEDVEAVRKLLNELVRTEECERSTEEVQSSHGTTVIRERISDIDLDGKIYKLPKDIWAIVYESVIIASEDPCLDGKRMEIYPTTLDSFSKIKRNPFRYNSNNRVLRLDIQNNEVELITPHKIAQYTVRYLKKPAPIVLVDLTEANLNIEGVQNAQIGELNPIIRRRIVEYAVRIAKQAYSPATSRSDSDREKQTNNN